jgi:hypothetical protein
MPHGFKLEVGSAVKVLTTTATEDKNKMRKKHKDYDDHKDLKEYKDSLKEYKTSKDHKDAKEYKDYKDHKDHKDSKECKESKDHKDLGDSEGIFTGIILDETELKLRQDERMAKPPIEATEEEQFLVLSLTKPSTPFSAGQIVWIRVDEIVALSLIGSSNCF